MPAFKVARVPLEEWLGDTLEITLEFLQSDRSTPRDKSASTWLAQVRTSPGADAVWATMDQNLASAASGVCVFSLPKETTATAVPGASYYVDVRETTGTDADFTGWAATIVWRQNVSRA